jgi:hypothetical protein
MINAEFMDIFGIFAFIIIFWIGIILIIIGVLGLVVDSVIVWSSYFS